MAILLKVIFMARASRGEKMDVWKVT